MRRLALLALASLPPLIAACGVFLGLSDHEPFPADADAPAPDVGIDTGPCGDTQSDPDNCGACGVACRTGYGCADGVCGNRVVELGAGGTFACVRLSAGEVWCWGSNVYGQLGTPPGGLPACNGQCRPTPAMVPGLPPAVALAVGPSSACTRGSDGSVLCWGLNSVGQLGHAPSSDAQCTGFACNPVPQLVANLPPATMITAGESLACALAGDGSVRCWGDNSVGQLGIGAPSLPHADPTQVAINDVTEIAASNAHPSACAVQKDGTASCWGLNYRGVLGHAGRGDSPSCMYGATVAPCNGTPSPILEFTGFSSPRVSSIACANKDDAGFYCWGDNGFGQLGLGTSDSIDHPTPAVLTVVTAVRLFGGVSHTCALDTNGAPSCWGDNFWGDTGDGTLAGTACGGGAPECVTRATPVQGLGNVAALSTGTDMTLALTADGAVWAWGSNVDARLGHTPGTGDAGAADQSCTFDGGGGSCNPAPERVLGLP